MWLKLLARPETLGQSPALICNDTSTSPIQIVQHWRNLGWMRQIKVYRLHRQAKRWKTYCWWRYPSGRWPCPPREIIARIQREISGGDTTSRPISAPNEVVFSLLCSTTPTQVILFHLDTRRTLNSEELHEMQTVLHNLYQILETEHPFHPELNPTDLRIAQMLLHGVGQSHIALELGQSESTIRSRIASLCRRHGVANRRMLMVRLLKTIGSKNRHALKSSMANHPSDWSEQHAQ